MKPVVVLVGRPNVGKSTLFNALTRSRAAIVADEPGVTRDRQYGDGRTGDRDYFVVDTGGLAVAGDGLRALMSAQTRQAISEADSIVLITDARQGLTAQDRELATELRRLNRPVTVAVNKAEGMEAAVAEAEFHALGLGAPVAVSAAHREGLDRLMDQALASLPPAAEEPAAPREAPRIAVVGRPNVGKSTLVNRLLGEERMVVADEPGTTRDAIRIPFTHHGREYVLIDTAGVRRRARVHETIEKHSVIRTLQAVAEADVVILVLDASQEVSEQDISLAGHVLEQGRAVVLAVNKWDAPDEEQRRWIRRELERKLTFLDFAAPHFISALEGRGVAELLPAVDRAYASARCHLPTPRLNRLLARAVEQNPPPRTGGHRPKLRYAHQGGRNPPRIVIHGTRAEHVPESYRRYLANTVRRVFRLEGTPVVIEFQSGDNPFAARRARGG